MGLTQWLVTSVLYGRNLRTVRYGDVLSVDVKISAFQFICEACGDKERSNIAFSGNPLVCVPLTPPVKSLSTCSGSQI